MIVQNRQTDKWQGESQVPVTEGVAGPFQRNVRVSRQII